MISDDRDRPWAAIIVPVFNAMSYLPETIPAMIGAVEAYGRAELLLVDNGSHDGSYQFLCNLRHPSVRVSQRTGVTISALRNVGFRESRAEILSFVDADCVVVPDHLIRSSAVLRSANVAATGSAYELPVEPHWIEATWHRMHRIGSDGAVRHLNAGNFTCLRSAFEAVGGFNETLATGEDAELCLRLVQAGYQIHSCGSIVVRHLGNPKTLRSFFRKQRWHALGSFGTWRLHRMDKPFLMTLAFLVLIVLGFTFTIMRHDWLGLLLLVGCTILVPVVSVIYRAVQSHQRPMLLRGTLLYLLYFGARAAGILAVLLDRRVERVGSSSHHMRG